MTGRLLIAGVGTIFLGDDCFGVEVASRLASADLPEWAHVVDDGIRPVTKEWANVPRDSG
jgi:hydrogenase maturation protease